MYAKWSLMSMAFFGEVAACAGLLLSYYAIIIWDSPDWTQLQKSTDYAMVVLRAIAWLCCLYLVVFVEFNQFRGGNYFKSPWNWLNVITYGAIIASIPLEIIRGSTIPARNGLLALIIVSLWINMLQYLSVFSSTGILIAAMGRMVRDVGQFFILYSVFLFGFSGALHLVLSDVLGYKTFVDTFITVLLMLFGNLNYDPYNEAAGWKWAISNVLLFGYLVSVVIVLLNVLIAMMSKSYDSVTEFAEEQYLLYKAEAILRIERSLSLSDRENQYAALIVGNQNARETVTLPTDTDASNDNSQHANGKVRPLGEVSENSTTDSIVEEPSNWIDGARYMYTKDMIRKSSSISVEMRFDNLESFVKKANSQTEMQIHNLTKSMTDMQKQLECLTSLLLVSQDATTTVDGSNKEVQPPSVTQNIRKLSSSLV